MFALEHVFQNNNDYQDALRDIFNKAFIMDSAVRGYNRKLENC